MEPAVSPASDHESQLDGVQIFINNNIYHPSTSPENDLEWETGILLRLRHQFFLPYEALILVSDAIHDNYNRSVLTIQVIIYNSMPLISIIQLYVLHSFIQLQEKLSTLVSTEVFGSTAFKAAFDKIHHQEQLTRYRLETTWDKFFPTVMPKEVILNRAEPSYNWINDPQLGKIMDEVFEIGYYIPFLQSLEQFLSIKMVYEAVMLSFRQSFKKNTAANDNQQQDVSYSDVWDGKYLKCHPLFIRHNGHILCIQVYMDEVETGNPLGRKKGKHKVCVFYWTLMNLPPIYRSTLRSIQLLGIVSCDLLKERGVDVFLKPFIDDLLRLRDGITLTIRNVSRKWYGILLHFVGDMPASNFVGGFKEGVGGAKLPCRTCMIVRDDLESIHHESGCTLRNSILQYKFQKLRMQN